MHVIRNSTVEHLFPKGTSFSGYDEFSNIPFDQEMLIWIYFLPFSIMGDEAIKYVNHYSERIHIVLSELKSNQSLIIFTLSNRLDGFTFVNSDYGLLEAILSFNVSVYKIADEYHNVRVIEIDDFYNAYSIMELVDWKYYYLSKMIINPILSTNFKDWFQRKLDAINYKRKKCLVLDLDNTLWGGVIGEDGIDGIRLGGDYPGNAFKDFQRRIKMSSNAGLILAINSKNNIQEVEDIFINHPEMVLKINDFSVVKANWEDKVENLITISDQLNIGLDSIVFLDDNPRERERVKSQLKMVVVPDFPDEPYELEYFFRSIYSKYFQIYKLSKEDINKSRQYQENIERNKIKSSTGSIEAYIAGLQIELTFYTNKNVARIAQMTQKTNQFNLTTRRYTETELRSIITNKGYLFSLGVKDRFGDSGITAAAIIQVDSNINIAIIDSFMLSCRILGKNIEKIFLHLIINTLYDMGIRRVESSFIRTSKNAQTSDFYEKNNFMISFHNDDIKKYLYEILDRIIYDTKYKISIES